MKTKQLIELLNKIDPSGEQECCIDNAPIVDVHSEVAYWDGCLQRIENGVGRYVHHGCKIKIIHRSIADMIWSNPEFRVEYDSYTEKYKAYDEAVRAASSKIENELWLEGFMNYVWSKVRDKYVDRSESDRVAREFFVESLLPATNCVQIGLSQFDQCGKHWDQALSVTVNEDGVKIENCSNI